MAGENLVSIKISDKTLTEIRDLLKTFTTLGSKEVFIKTLNNQFPGAQFKVAYEAGCFGYHIADYIRQSGSCRMKLSYFRLTEFQLLRAYL